MTSSSPSPASVIDEYGPLVMSIASKIHRRLPPHVALEDLVSYGQLGLLQAANSYSAEAGSTLATYAYYRIRGAIYDGLTKMAWSSRAEYRRLKADQAAAEVLEQAASEPGGSGSSDDDFRWLLDATDRLAIVYLSALGGGDAAGGDLPDAASQTPDECLQAREAAGRLRELVAQLPEPDRSLIRLAYYDDLSLADAAARLGKSRSWASRVHARILTQLARSLRALGVE